MPSAGADVGTLSQKTPGPAQSGGNIPRIQSQIPSTILGSPASKGSRLDTLGARFARPFVGFPRARYRVVPLPAVGCGPADGVPDNRHEACTAIIPSGVGTP